MTMTATPAGDTLRPTPPPGGSPSQIIRWVALAIVAWGIFHAIGAWRFNHNPLRAVVVLVCVGMFLGFWMTMLAVRKRRLKQEGTPR